MNTAARRKASADYHAKLKAEGHKKVTLFLSPEAQVALTSLTKDGTSKNAAVNAALIAAAKAVQKAAKPDVDALVDDVAARFPKTLAKLHEAEKTEPSQGLKGDGAPPQKALDLPIGQQPFKPRLKTPKGKK